jgi:nucleoside-diphosphate-sugar epimerase
MKKIKKVYLITGCAGFLGYHWTKHLLKKKLNVIGIDLKPFPEEDLLKNKNFKFYNQSIFDYELMKELIDSSDYICHFAGIAEPQKYLDFPERVINLTAYQSIKIIKYCINKKKLFFFTSTSEIFGKNPQVPFQESSDRVLGSTSISRWCYSSSKAIVEHYLYACAKEKKIDFVGIRLFNIYGKNLKGRVVSTFMENAIRNKNLVVTKPGNQTRSFMYVDDCVNIMDKLLHSKKSINQFFNIGNVTEVSILSLAKLIKKITKSKSKIILKEFKDDNYQDIPQRATLMNKLKKITNYKAKFNLEKGLKKYFDTIIN